MSAGRLGVRTWYGVTADASWHSSDVCGLSVAGEAGIFQFTSDSTSWHMSLSATACLSHGRVQSAHCSLDTGGESEWGLFHFTLSCNCKAIASGEWCVKQTTRKPSCAGERGRWEMQNPPLYILTTHTAQLTGHGTGLRGQSCSRTGVIRQPNSQDSFKARGSRSARSAEQYLLPRLQTKLASPRITRHARERLTTHIRCATLVITHYTPQATYSSQHCSLS